MRIPIKRFAVAILANVANIRTERLSHEITDLYLGYKSAKLTTPPSKPSADFHPDPSSWDSFLGTYRLGAGWLLTITREHSQLMAQATQEPKFDMTPLATNIFFVEAYGSEVEFVHTNTGPVTHLLYRGIHAPKLRIPECTPDLLASYIGDYWSEELRVAYHIEVQNGELGTHHRSGIWVRFLPIDQDRFDTAPGNLALAFSRNGVGAIDEMKVSGERTRNIRFTRVSFSKSFSQ